MAPLLVDTRAFSRSRHTHHTHTHTAPPTAPRVGRLFSFVHAPPRHKIADRMLPPRARLPPGVALARMRPYSAALCIVRSRQRIGFAHSDPYLSTATPIATANFDASPSDLRHLLEDVSVGLIVLGSAPALDFSSYKEQLILPESVQAISSNSISCCEWECNLTLEEVRYHCSTSDHWENVSTALNGSGTMLAKELQERTNQPSHTLLLPHHAAAIALQHLLDEEIGGWMNTFG